MSKPMTLGSLFDGIGGFPLAGIYAGMKPVWASEIEPFPIRVTTKRLPDMKHYGDINKLDGAELPPVDVITFGSPCTDLSIAGKRSGLGGEQSSLFFEAIRVIREMREKTNGQYPKYLVWENVPGAMSSAQGWDYCEVLRQLVSLCEGEADVPMPENGRWLPAGEIMGDTYSVAWRIIDAAQGWGVAQRRKRIFIVVDLAGGRAGKILFESEGLSGYSPPSGETRQGASQGAEGCAGETGTCVLNDQGGQRLDMTYEETNTLRAKTNGHEPIVLSAGFCTEHSADSRGIGYAEEESPTLRAGVTPGIAIEFNPSDSRVKIKDDGICQTITARAGTGGNNVPLTLKIRAGCAGGGKGPIVQANKSATLSCNNDQTLFQPVPTPVAYGISSYRSNAMLSDNPHAGIYEADTSRTLDCSGGSPVQHQGGMAVVESFALQGNMIGREDRNGPQGDGVNKEVSFTLNTIDRHAVCAVNAEPSPSYCMTTGSYGMVGAEEAPTLAARDYKDAPVVGTVSAPNDCNSTYAIDRSYFNAGENAKFASNIHHEVSPALIARGPSAVAGKTVSGKETFGTLEASMSSKQWLGNQEAFSGDYHVLQPDYKVRRLTPLECCRLQGYPDGWTENLGTEEPTEQEIAWWAGVFEKWYKSQGKTTAVTRNRVIKWLKDPRTDGAEYKAYGNSVCVNCVFFVLAGIVWAEKGDGQNERD